MDSRYHACKLAICSNPSFLPDSSTLIPTSVKMVNVKWDMRNNSDLTSPMVSHDRYFQKTLVTRVFEIDNGELQIYEGRYDEYLARCEALQKEHFFASGIRS